ncbi:ParA family protein [Rhodopirellula europaea]|uniref:ParA family protein n=1 Tax=Rhodopirellula europaea TaxID=1263866 RepID=UPI003D2916DD
MQLVSVWNPKGGQGKSLIAINLSAAAVELGLKPLVVCDDPQGTATLFSRGGRLSFDVVEKMPAKKPNADLVIIDHGARDWDLPPAPIVLMPTKPDRSDIATYQDAVSLLRPTGKKVIPIITDAQGHRASHARAVRAMRKIGAFELRSSGVYGRAAEDWMSIFDPSLNTAYKVGERRSEFSAILTAVLNLQNQPGQFAAEVA